MLDLSVVNSIIQTQTKLADATQASDRKDQDFKQELLILEDLIAPILSGDKQTGESLFGGSTV